jgi:hypothetical protein
MSLGKPSLTQPTKRIRPPGRHAGKIFRFWIKIFWVDRRLFEAIYFWPFWFKAQTLLSPNIILVVGTWFKGVTNYNKANLQLHPFNLIKGTAESVIETNKSYLIWVHKYKILFTIHHNVSLFSGPHFSLNEEPPLEVRTSPYTSGVATTFTPRRKKSQVWSGPQDNWKR